MNPSVPFFQQGSDRYPELFKSLVSYLQQGELPESLQKIYYVPIEDILPDAEYQAIDYSILNLFSRGPLLTLLGTPFSHYYRIQRRKRHKSIPKTWQYIHKYYRLFRSMKQNRFSPPDRQLKAYPWIFVSDTIQLRLDGHHRAAIYRFLGETRIPAMVLTPQQLLTLPLPEKLRQQLAGHASPSRLEYQPYPS